MTFDPSTNEIQFVPQPPVNMSLFLVHTMTLVSFVQLCGAFNFDLQSPLSQQMEELYNERLACCKTAVELVRIVIAAGIPLRTFPTTCGVSYLLHCFGSAITEGSVEH